MRSTIGVAIGIAVLVLALVKLPTAQTRIDQRALGTGVIAGRVVDTETKIGVRGATVDLFPIRDGLTATGDPISVQLSEAEARSKTISGPQSVVTGADGRFLFSGLSAGAYEVVVHHKLYLVGSYGGYVPLRDHGRLQVRGNQPLPDVEVRLAKYPVITGRVADEANEPGIDLEVHALRRQLVAGQWRFRDAGGTRTDDRGEFRFTNLRPGDYMVAVPSAVVSAPQAVAASYDRGTQNVVDQLTMSGATIPARASQAIGAFRVAYRGPAGRLVPSVSTIDGRLSLVYPTTFSPSSTSPIGATLIAATPGAEVRADVQLNPVRTFMASGVLRGPNGLAGPVGVRLLPAWSELLESDRGFEAAITTTADDGNFVFLGVPPGTYAITSLIDRIRWAPRPGSLASLPMMSVIGPNTVTMRMEPAAEPVLWGMTSAAIGDHDETGLTLSLQPGVRLGGRVQVDDPTAVAEGPQTLFGSGRLGITLTPVDTTRDGLARSTSIDERGQFLTAAYPPGRYFITVRLPGAPWRVKSVVANGREAFCAAVDLQGSDVSDAVLTLTTTETTLAGTVRAEANAGVPATGGPSPTVVAFPSDSKHWIDSGMNSQCAKSAVAREGTFTLRNMLPGDYLIAVVDGHDTVDVHDPDFVRTVARVGTRVSVHPGLNQAPMLVLRK